MLKNVTFSEDPKKIDKLTFENRQLNNMTRDAEIYKVLRSLRSKP